MCWKEQNKSVCFGCVKVLFAFTEMHTEFTATGPEPLNSQFKIRLIHCNLGYYGTNEQRANNNNNYITVTRCKSNTSAAVQHKKRRIHNTVSTEY